MCSPAAGTPRARAPIGTPPRHPPFGHPHERRPLLRFSRFDPDNRNDQILTGWGERSENDAEADVLSAETSSAICVQRLDDSRNSAIHTTYRISLRSSSLREPRYPLLRVVFVLSADRPVDLRFRAVSESDGTTTQAPIPTMGWTPPQPGPSDRRLVRAPFPTGDRPPDGDRSPHPDRELGITGLARSIQ